MEFGRDEVHVQITKYVSICAHGLDIPMDNIKLQLLVEDLTDKYKYDSIEDIQQCLKNGRRGDYGPTYGKFNMIVITEWMSKHLDRKAAAMESQNSKAKHEFKDREEYENAVKVGLDRQEKEKKQKKESDQKKKRDARAYDEFRQQYNQDIKDKGVNPGGLIPEEE